MTVGAAARLTVADLSALTATEFAAAMGPYFEGAPRFCARLAAARPFHDADHLFARAAAIAASMPEAAQIELVDAHPRIGAAPGSVSAASFVEQGYGREGGSVSADKAVAGEGRAADLARLNDAYEARFGFRFVIFVAGRPRRAIVPIMETRLAGDRLEELQTALADVVAIANDRWGKQR